MFTKELLAPVFNRYFYDFLEEVKKNSPSSDLTSRINDRYKVRNLKSQKNLQYFEFQFFTDKHIFEQLLDMENFSGNLCAGAASEKNLFKDVKLVEVMNACDGTTKGNAAKVFFYVLMLLAQIDVFYQKVDETDMEDINVLFNNIVNILHLLDTGKSVEKELQDVYHENIKTTIRIICQMKDMTEEKKQDGPSDPSPSPSSSQADVPPIDPFMEQIGDELKKSKLGSLANEIMQEAGIDEKSFQNINDIGDVFKSADMGKILETTTRSFQNKMQKGEISHQDLIGECMGLLGKMGTASSSVNPNMPGMNPQDMANVMNLFGNKFDPMFNTQNNTHNNHANPTKNRLQNRIQERK